MKRRLHWLLWLSFCLAMPTLAQTDVADAPATWEGLEYGGNPWVSPLSQPYSVTQGLQGRHLALWPSHGRYFDQTKGTWQWQRPRIYCTTEDIYTQSIVTPFLIPALERAGAVVFTPRERDWQRTEVVVDNDAENANGHYVESNGTHEWQYAGTGFAPLQDIYFDGENPFLLGTSRRAEAQPRKRQASHIVWQPRLPHDGRYAVYVSYVTLPTSVSDAEYTVRHRGIATRFRVNQQMGGGTWVYLGTFDFAAGQPEDNCVQLTNQSNYRGTVTADAVRFGGGMGNISRGDSLHAFVRSCLPRYLEGSRYYAQWAGMPRSVYATKDATNDYAEDINARSLMLNRLARGSVYLPGDSGLAVPIELSLAIHSDAGFSPDSSIIGTLGIYTTGPSTLTSEPFDGLLAEGLYPSRRSRRMALGLCDSVMTQVVADLRSVCPEWNRRPMYDRNYSETRLPEVPGIILETLSHQNWADLLHGHDPTFKMLLARAIYKGVLHHIAATHRAAPPVVQPLAVRNFAAILNARGDSVHLSWQPTADPLAPTATPTGYAVYTSEGDRGFDNGRAVYATEVSLPVRRGTLTRYHVRAFNAGGASMPSEELCVYAAPQERHRMLIVNAFSRLAGPQPVDNDSLRGFDFDQDPGVVYKYSPAYCGRQTNMRRNEGEDFGQSGSELEGILVAGNTFDFPTLHALDFLASHPELSISSCSAAALPSPTSHLSPLTSHFACIDLLLGAQRADGYSLNAQPALPQPLCRALEQFAQRGSSLLLSGAYIAGEIDPAFSVRVLHALPDGHLPIAEGEAPLTGMNTSFHLYVQPNEERYSIRRLSVLRPMPDAFCTIASAATPLAVAHQGQTSRTLTYGFPLECIRQPEVRRAVMAASLRFLLENDEQ